MSDSIANGYGCRPCKQVQLNVTDAIIHFIGDGSALSHLNASNVDFGTLSTSVFPASGVTIGTYGSSANVAQVTIDTYGRVTSATNVAITSSQWTGTPGNPIYYIPGVGIGSSSPATANLQVTGNVYVSNSVTTTNVFATRYYGDGGLLSNISSDAITQPFANLVVSNAVTTTNVFATRYYGDGGLLSNISSDAITQPFANLVVSNSVTTTNIFATSANIATMNVSYLTADSAIVYGSSLNVYGTSNLTNVTVTDTFNVNGSMTANAANATFFFDTFTIPYINTQYLNVASNIVLTGNLSAPLANIETLNVNYLTVNSAVVYGTSTLNVYGVSNLSTVTAQTMNVYGDCFIGNTAITGSVQTTTGPMSRLTFDNTANTSIYPNKIVLFANTASSQYCGFGVTDIGPTGGASLSYGARANHIFYTGTALNTEIMRITSGSTVGVGTTTPTAKFHVVGNIYASNALTTTNVFTTTANIATTNTQTLTVTSNMTFTGPLATLSNLTVPGNANIEYLSVSNLAVTGNLYVTATNVQTTNALTINNSGTMTALKVTQNETSIHTHNVAEFWDATTLAMVIDPEGNVAIHTTSSPGYALTVTDPANFETLYIRGKTGTASLNVTGNVYVSNAVATTNIFASTGLDVGPSTLGSNVVVFSNISGGANTFIMDSRGRVSIGAGTQGGGSLLSFGQQSANKIIALYDGNSADNPVNANNFYGFGVNGNTLRYQVPSSTTDRHTFFGGSSEFARITGTGISILTGAAPSANLHVSGNIYASNAVTTTNVFANTLTMSNATSTINVTGNIYASNAVTTTNLFTAGITSNVTGTTFNSDTLTIPFLYSTTLNVASTSNLDTVTITGEPGLTSLNVTGNIYASNALVTTNIFASREILSGTTGQTTLNVIGNIYASNALTTTNVFANTTTLTGTTGQTTLNVTGNIYASNALTTTNVFASNVTASGFLEADSTWMLGVSGTTQRTFRSGRVTGLSGVTDTVQGTATVTFGYTAASTNYRVIATVDGLTSAFPFTVAVSNKTTTTFDVRVLKINSTGASTVAVDWLLIE